MTWVDISEGVDHLVTAGAVLIGGLWAYFKFIRGRTFANRAELHISSYIDDTEGRRSIGVGVRLENAGLTKIDLAKNRGIVWVYGTSGSEWSGGRNAKWHQLMLTLVLVDHKWIEAQETIEDDVLIPVPITMDGIDAIVAYRLHAEVWAVKKLLHRKGVRWSGNAIVTLPKAPTNVVPHAEVGPLETGG
jgi:hypothetical protein